jgi:hypothetical protein
MVRPELLGRTITESLSRAGPPEAIEHIINANSYQRVLYAISRFEPDEPDVLQAAFARALRAVASACAELVGPSLWGVQENTSSVRDEAKLALDNIFRVRFHPHGMHAPDIRSAVLSACCFL